MQADKYNITEGFDMQYVLENDKLRLTVNSAGAEMKSLIKKSDGQELLWRADPKFWGRTAPVLFPLVGRVVGDSYTDKGNTYEMKQHGFGRDSEFSLLSQSDDELVFSLKDNEETKKKYPYSFELQISYKMDKNNVHIGWKVINPSDETIYFSLGGHPAFACPLKDGEKQADYSFLIDTDSPALTCAKFDDGYVTGETYECALNDKRLAITPHLFDGDALVIENHQAQKVTLLDGSQNPYLAVSFDAPVFGLWSPPGKEAPFVCIEPWYGRCDNKNFTGEWKDREWGNSLDAGAEFNGGFDVEVL